MSNRLTKIATWLLQNIGLHKRLVLIFAFGMAAVVQTPAEQKQQFEVASIKRTASGEIGIRPEGDRFAASGMTLRNVIQFAYLPCDGRPLLDNQIIGTPGWADTDTYNIEAKTESRSQPIPICEMKQMVQSLLAERFQLKAHFEKRELPVYNLIVMKPGKVKPSSDQTPSPPPPAAFTPRGDSLPRGVFMIRSSGPHETTILGTSVPMERFVKALSGSELRNRPVMDKTGLKGLFDVQLRFAPQSMSAAPASDPSGPSIFAALEEQLGLKLESGRGPLQVLVIDSVSRPTEN